MTYFHLRKTYTHTHTHKHSYLINWNLYIYNNKWSWEKLKLEFQIRVSICDMCLKLFILKEFYFLILESNMRPYHKYSFKWVIKYKNQRVYNKWIVKKKVLHNKFFFFLKMDNLHFIHNNILRNFFKELTKYKNNYQ